MAIAAGAASNLPIGSGPSPPALQSSTRSTSAPFQAGQLPVSDGLCVAPQSRHPHFPLAFRPVGVGFLDHPVPAMASASLTATHCRLADHIGVPTFRSLKIRLSRASPIPRARWCQTPPKNVQRDHLALLYAEGLSASTTSRLLAVGFSRHCRGFARARPSQSSPHLCFPDGSGHLGLSSPASHPTITSDACGPGD